MVVHVGIRRPSCETLIRRARRARLGDLCRRVKYHVRNRLGERPVPFFMLLGLNQAQRSLMVRPSTDIVVEGFPRSANTFAVAALTITAGRPIAIARHLHVPAQIIRATQMGLPTLVLIRSPEDSAVSLVIRLPYLRIRDALTNYIRYYRAIRRYRDRFVLATFEEVTKDFGAVIIKLNRRFNTRFGTFEHTEARLRECFAMVDRMDMRDTGRHLVTATHVARPSTARNEMKEHLRLELSAPSIRELLTNARGIYLEYTARDC